MSAGAGAEVRQDLRPDVHQDVQKNAGEEEREDVRANAPHHVREDGTIGGGAQGEASWGSDCNLLAHLLHALNQPLTGLQCSLELAAMGPRTAEQYRYAIAEGLELVGRMRLLVEALREVADMNREAWAQESWPQEAALPLPSLPPGQAIALDTLVHGILEDLRPVAESRALQVEMSGNRFTRLCRVRRGVAEALFRVFDSVLSLAASPGALGIHLDPQSRRAVVVVDWVEQNGGAGRPAFSPPELGLLVAQAAWRQAGGDWQTQTAQIQTLQTQIMQTQLMQTQQTLILSLPWVPGEPTLGEPTLGEPPPLAAPGDLA